MTVQFLSLLSSLLLTVHQRFILEQDAPLMGYVLVGGISLARGHGYATGAVSCRSLLMERLTLISTGDDHGKDRAVEVLVRNRGDVIAWPARLRIMS